MKKSNLILVSVIILFSLIFVQCSKDEAGMEEKGQISVKVTDAPSDDPNIKGTFITIADVKIDGQSVEGFTKQTIEISAYQKGEAKLLLNGENAAKSYSSISVVLDNETDASGNSPGCYVLTNDDKKNNLYASSVAENEITCTKDFEVVSNSETSMVIDFDLRKLVVHNTDTPEESEYKFVSSAEMKTAVRMVKEDNCGLVAGEVSNTISSDNETYVFIYEKGKFEASAEQEGQGANNVLFARAITSAKIESDGSYTLSFLEEGDYEIHLASYAKMQTENKWAFKGMLNANSAISGLLLNNISVSADTRVELNIDVLGLL
jgi:hypothetical protein